MYAISMRILLNQSRKYLVYYLTGYNYTQSEAPHTRVNVKHLRVFVVTSKR